MFSNRGRAGLNGLCSVFLPHGAIYWFAICDCSISWSYSLLVAVGGGDVLPSAAQIANFLISQDIKRS